MSIVMEGLAMFHQDPLDLLAYDWDGRVGILARFAKVVAALSVTYASFRFVASGLCICFDTRTFIIASDV